MKNNIIGRSTEQATLNTFLKSPNAEFLAIYGRRRVGKTYLIRQFFEHNDHVIFLKITGTRHGTQTDQIQHFTKQLSQVFYGGAKLQPGKNWDEVFEQLTDAIASISSKHKIVMFFDEFPWLATKNSRLLQNLDYYWNQHWSTDNRVKLIICGSAASWIVKKVIHDKGGLHNRVTYRIRLEPYNLGDTRLYLKHLGVKLKPFQIAQIYMVTGGIPFYLSKVEPGKTATQTIEQLAFQKQSFLLEEFDHLFSALFDDSETHVKIVRTIAATRYGVGQEDLLKKLGPAFQGKSGLDKLESLVQSGFVMRFKPHGRKRRGLYYRVVDEYTLFYFDWIEPVKETLLTQSLQRGYWEQTQQSSRWKSWSGMAFESICYKHIAQISQALKLGPTAIPNTWRHTAKKGADEQGAQVDLLFDRDDDAITLCEIKFNHSPYTIDKAYAQTLKTRCDVFQTVTKTPKEIFLAMITASGLKPTLYSEEMISGVVTLEDLFAAEN